MKGDKRWLKRFVGSDVAPVENVQLPTGPVSVCVGGEHYVIAPRTVAQTIELSRALARADEVLQNAEQTAGFLGNLLEAYVLTLTAAFSPDCPRERIEALDLVELMRVTREELPKLVGKTAW